MKIWAIAYAALVSISSISHGAEAQMRLPSIHNNIEKLLLKEIQNNKININDYVSVKFAKGKDGDLVLSDNKPVYPTKHQLSALVNHWGSPAGEKFNLTYWVYDKHYKEGGPIFLYLSGEVAITEYGAGVLLNYSRINDLQEKFGGLGIALQHRYYGESTPQSAWGSGTNEIDIHTPAEKFRWLRTDLALEDIRFFADSFNHSSERVPAGINLRPEGTPWVVLGGSYAGNMASILRKWYPNTFFAAYSSSAPVEARTTMPMYWDIVARAIGSTEPACIKNMHSAIKYIDQELGKDEKSAAAIKQMFLGPSAESNTNGWFTETLGYPFYGYQMTGMNEPIIDDTVWSIKHFCDHMNTDGDAVSPIEGWESIKNSTLQRSGKWGAERWASWPGYIALIKSFGYSCSGFGTAQGPGTCSLPAPATNPEDRAWLWQVCYEWGYFQIGNPGPDQIMSKFSDVKHWKSKCDLTFNDKTAKGYLSMSSKPNTNITNRLYGGWNDPQPRTFYTVGENDPWSSLGFLETRFLTDKTDAPEYIANSTIPACDHKPSKRDLFGFIIKEGVHAADIVSFKWSRETLPLFVAALEAWLPCFERPAGKKPTELYRQNPTPTINDQIKTNQTFTIRPSAGKQMRTTVRELVRVTSTENKIRLERRAKLWSD
ncbi:uncharacterized protein DFL_000594 [Arthrobotrys flagrans]|uniref:Serine carboxypeptidase S28 n=1 Tax=Arthrobotrys flagrans TaxID=97331 RepID=A0A437AEC1_ARTFL|nr:hypothetical protein DFL_000594 [Arthrobotrys flagrans]